MQYIDNDMDDLFRKAAKDYPLNTNSGDWEEVVKKIAANDSERTIVPPVNKKNHKLFLLLLLLLPLAWLGHKYFNFHILNDKNIIAGKHVSKNIVSPSAVPNTASFQNINQQFSTVPPVLTGHSQTFIQQVKLNIVHYKQNTRLQSVQSVSQINTTVPRQSSSHLQDESKKEETRTIDNNKYEESIKNANENNVTTQPENDKKENDNTAATTKTKKQKLKKEHGMYAGIFISPDISTVKFQSVKNTGSTIGLLIGYQLNKKISIETGLAWNKKYYYSRGEYFNVKKIAIAANAKILKLDGVCKMIEVPVNLKYNFRSSVKTNLSLSGGVSSYIMKSEKYTYTIDHLGQQYPRNADYKNSSTNLLAVATLGFGYNHSLRRGALLRLEPYLKFPVTGVGIGKLPLMSTGINIGITKKLF